MDESMGTGPYSVTEVQHSTITLSDGIKLAMKVWLPCRKDEIEEFFPYFGTEKQLSWSTEINIGAKSAAVGNVFPVILEYLPYSKDSLMTLQRDHTRHSWFCSHGYIDVRVDIRGTGASEGLYFDEYDEQEFVDCIDVINWFTAQPWSNGKVGMYGKSYGGFNGLQMAYKQPDALKAVISLYSTDNRFTDDVHYEGGAIVGNGMLSWAGFMMALNGRPPHPKFFDTYDEWKTFWTNRLNKASQSFLCSWLHHQHQNDSYWQHGSIGQNVTRVECPVLVIGGLTDAYTSAAFRMAGSLNEYSRAVIGPWSHQWPDVSIPGPNIDYLNQCLKWWSAYLKGDVIHQKEVFDWPRLDLFIRDSLKPQDITKPHKGKWVSLNDWNKRMDVFNDSTSSMTQREDDNYLRSIYLGCDGKLFLQQPENSEVSPIKLNPNPNQGSGSGLWFSVDEGFFEDQTKANENSHCWVSDILNEDIVFAGLSKFFVTVEAATSGQYCIHVRVCEQFLTGESFLVTRGFLNLNESNNDGWVGRFPSNTKSKMCVNLKGVAHTVPKGHRLLISITPTYFPMIYPAIKTTGLTMYPSESFLVLQTCQDVEKNLRDEYQPPKSLFQLPVEYLTASSFLISDSSSDSDGKWTRDFQENSGVVRFPTMQFDYYMISNEKYVTDAVVSFGDISADQLINTTFHMDHDRMVRTLVETRQTMSGDKQAFRITEEICVRLEGEELFKKEWDYAVPRKYV